MAAAKSGKRNVLVAVDGTANSATAFEWFLESAYKPGDFVIICHIPQIPELPSFTFKWFLENVYHENDHVLICHVPHAPKLPSFSFKAGLKVPADEWQSLVQSEIEKTQKLYNHYQYELEQRKIQCTLVGEHRTSTGAGIIEAAESHEANFIVIGTRSLDGITRTFKGSVSDYVIHHAHCPVIIVPTRK